MKGDDVAARLLDFAVAVQEARGAESRADFVHKIRLAAKEVRESRYWLDVVQRAKLLHADLSGHLREATELAAILAASAKTARTSSES